MVLDADSFKLMDIDLDERIKDDTYIKDYF